MKNHHKRRNQKKRVKVSIGDSIGKRLTNC